MPTRDDDSDRLDPAEFPDPDAADDDLAECPACRAVIYEDTVRCPACGEYVSGSGRGKPLWVVLGVLVCLAISIGWVVFG